MPKAEHLVNILQFQLSKGRGSNIGKRGSGPGVNTGLTGVVWKRQEFWEKDTLLSLQGMITPDY